MISAEEFLRRQPPVLSESPAVFEESASEDKDVIQEEDSVDRDISVLKNIAQAATQSHDTPLTDLFERDAQRDKCQEAALRLLDAAQRPSGALHDRLVQKEFSEEVIEQVIARLIELGLVNDEEYARMAVRYCISRNMGEMGTLRELKRKGVDAYTASHAVADAREEGAFVESAYALAEYVAKRTRGLDKQVRLRRLWSAAGRKGHSPDLIRQAVYDVFDSEEEM
ncbi:regulatory protein RecX [Alloscardovia macacae]|uniref:Regulatory protein RecX n=1 Tax=Alloscardovia macacae TaxID=1160091 RepID=A0A261F5C8_9BIFI|nr:regulatory protein RecX [Alloscardovia macacae]OZG54320.1 RecX family transcriptional regulator [Alloscardovia macacae]